MRVVLQRVSEASVLINKVTRNSIGQGLVLLVCFEDADTYDDIKWMVNKIINLRIFLDNEGKMNLSLQEVNGELLVVSQFTLYASTKKGNRPGFIRAAKPEISVPLYEQFLSLVKKENISNVSTGEFGVSMEVSLTNVGPVTISIDSKQRE